MLNLLLTVAATLSSATAAPDPPFHGKIPYLNREYRQGVRVDVDPPRATRAIIRVPFYEYGGASQPAVVTITATGRSQEEAEMVLRQFLEELAKPSAGRER